MPEYEDLKDELENIATLIEAYPDKLKIEVFNLLIYELYDGEVPKPLAQVSTNPIARPKVEAVKRRKQKQVFGNGHHGHEKKTVNSGGCPDFPTFINSCKKPSSAPKKNLSIIYHNEHVMKGGPIKTEEIKKKYKEMGWKPNKKFHQSLIDTKNRNNWIYKVNENDPDHESEGWLTTHQGTEFVKEDLLLD